MNEIYTVPETCASLRATHDVKQRVLRLVFDINIRTLFKVATESILCVKNGCTTNKTPRLFNEIAHSH